MDEKLKMEIAKFRFGVISDFVTGMRFARGEHARLIREKTEKQWSIPGSTRSSISKGTIQLWISKYRASGCRLESLMPLERVDKGQHRALDLEVRLALTDLRSQYPTSSLPELVRRLKERKVLAPDETLNPATTYRYLNSLPVTETKSSDDADKRKFEAEYPNQLWQADVCHGPKILSPRGTRQKTYLFAIMDDHSRLVTGARFYMNETTECLKKVLEQALAARGKPQKFYSDNGSCYRSQSLETICARLGVVLVHARPYRPQGKGKIERFFRTIRGSLFARFEDPCLTLDDLNAMLEEWLAEYHEREHSSLGCSPLERYRKGLECVRPAPANLSDYFREQATRRVRNDRTIQLEGRFFEVHPGLIGRKVEARWHTENPEDVEVFFEEASYGKAPLVDLAVNMRTGRDSLKEKEPKSEASENPSTEEHPIKGGELFNEKQSIGDTNHELS